MAGAPTSSKSKDSLVKCGRAARKLKNIQNIFWTAAGTNDLKEELPPSKE